MQLNATVLAIGTEITSGEVVNSNAAWIADQAERLGFFVSKHIAVPDDRQLILKTLQSIEAEAKSEAKPHVVVITGGLGPTTDDITRELVAEWTGTKLEFSEVIWQELQSLFKKKGLDARVSHRHQCFFPKTSQILRNTLGTAHGFQMIYHHLKVFVLPGPPKEIQAMWEVSVRPELQRLGSQSSSQLHTWTCLGLRESELAEKVEAYMAGKGCTIGYRATVPYVKVKVWIPTVSNSEMQKRESNHLLEGIESLLSPWLVAKGKADPIEPLVNYLKQRFGQSERFGLIQDEISQGKLGSRLTEAFRDLSGIGGWPSKLSMVTGEISGLSHTVDLESFELKWAHDDQSAVELIWKKAREEQREVLGIGSGLTPGSNMALRFFQERAICKLSAWVQSEK